MSADAAGAPPDHVDIVRAGIRIHPDEPDDVMNVKTDAELIAYALRYLADDTEDHRPKTATRMRAIAAGIESGPVGMSDREKARDLGNQSAHLARGIADLLNDTLDALEAAEKEREIYLVSLRDAADQLRRGVPIGIEMAEKIIRHCV